VNRERLYRWRRHWFRLGIWHVVYRFWFRVYVEGWENIPADGPLLIIGNHIGVVDPLVMISFYPDRDIVPMAKIEAFGAPITRFFVTHWGAIPVRRGEGDLQALKSTLDHIRKGYAGMLYAEGTRSPTGLIQGQAGSVYLALKTGATVVPVAIWGTRELRPAWLGDFRRMPVYLRFGLPFRFKHEGNKMPRERFQVMIDEAMYRIAEMLPEDMRGIYSDLSQATTEYLDFDITWRRVETPLPRWCSTQIQAV
jgi:1-acyl-sn-glycerol-3-phosphate acyltransferase